MWRSLFFGLIVFTFSQTLSYAGGKSYCQYFDKADTLMQELSKIDNFMIKQSITKDGRVNFDINNIKEFQDKINKLKALRRKFKKETSPLIDDQLAKINGLYLYSMDNLETFIEKNIEIINAQRTDNLDFNETVAFFNQNTQANDDNNNLIREEMNKLTSQNPELAACGPSPKTYLTLFIPALIILGVSWFFINKN